MIPNKRGKPLFMLNNYTYYKNSKYSYYCSRYMTSLCKSRVKLDTKGKIIYALEIHNHQPPTYMKTDSGELIKI